MVVIKKCINGLLLEWCRQLRNSKDKIGKNNNNNTSMITTSNEEWKKFDKYSINRILMNYWKWNRYDRYSNINNRCNWFKIISLVWSNHNNTLFKWYSYIGIDNELIECLLIKLYLSECGH